MSELKNGYPDYLIRVDERGMKILIGSDLTKLEGEPVETDDNWSFKAFPAKYVICDNCRGKGTTVNPAIDGNGLSQEDFDEDPDFREDYMSGKYDVSCECCGGSGKILVPATEEVQNEVNRIMQGYYQDKAEEAAERRMGC